MRVRVRGVLFLQGKLAARGIDSSGARLTLAEGARVADAVAACGLAEREVEAAFVNHRTVPLDSTLGDGDQVVLVPPGTPGPHRYLLGIARPPEERAMGTLPEHELVVYRDREALPPGAEEMFASQLADSRRPLPQERWDRELWRFALTCAVTPAGEVLGGVYLDIGPIGGAGPLARERLAYLERTFVRPDCRRQGLATRLLCRAIEVARDAGALYIRCSNNWDNAAERALFLRCGFALIDLDGEADDEPCYLAVRPLTCSAPAHHVS